MRMSVDKDFILLVIRMISMKMDNTDINSEDDIGNKYNDYDNNVFIRSIVPSSAVLHA